MKVDKAFCINLDSRKDRWGNFNKTYPKHLPAVERFAGLTHKEIPMPSSWLHNYGSWGCYCSHVRILQSCVRQKINSVLIFEDDAIPTPFVETCYDHFSNELPDDWQWVYLGGAHYRPEVRTPRLHTFHVYRAYAVRLTHAYAVRGSFMENLLDALLSRHLWEMSQARHLDHFYTHLQTNVFTNVKVWCPANWFFQQAAGESDISNVKVSETKHPHACDIAKDKRYKHG